MTNKKYTNCDRCKKPIYYGNAYVCITRSIEQADFDIAKNREEITVIDSEEIITFCGSCGNMFDQHTIGNIINSIPTDGMNPGVN
jgi:hypothetical protein